MNQCTWVGRWVTTVGSTTLLLIHMLRIRTLWWLLLFLMFWFRFRRRGNLGLPRCMKKSKPFNRFQYWFCTCISKCLRLNLDLTICINRSITSINLRYFILKNESYWHIYTVISSDRFLKGHMLYMLQDIFFIHGNLYVIKFQIHNKKIEEQCGSVFMTSISDSHEVLVIAVSLTLTSPLFYQDCDVFPCFDSYPQNVPVLVLTFFSLSHAYIHLWQETCVKWKSISI